LKFLPKEFSRDPEAKKRFIDEARSSSKLDHPNICVIYDINETDDGQLFISMNYCKGENLQNYLKEKDLTLKEVTKYIIQVATGLEKAHNVGIVHCDIKPTNIIITDDGVAKIVDFGIAKIANEEKLISKDRTSGTIAYMSPEQVSNTNIDARSDIWSLGVVFHEMLTKQVPFDDSYNEALMYSIINEVPESIISINQNIPHELEQIVFRMLAKNPEDRYQSIKKLLDDLYNYQKIVEIPINPLKYFKLFLSNNKNKRISLISALILSIFIVTIVYITVIRGSDVPSIGILNMENLGNPDDEFWSRGITKDLIIDVASAGVIRVPTFTEVNKFNESDFKLKDIAEKLRVDYLLSSSILKSDSTFELWCRIIDPKSGKDIFARKWSKPAHEVSNITTILAGTVLSNLGISSKTTLQPVIIDPDAYEFYLKGKHIRETRNTTDDILLARGLLQQALQRNPQFMQAKIQLGLTYSDIADFTQALEIFKECLEHGNSNNDENTTALAMFNIGNIYAVQYNSSEALNNYKKALKIRRRKNDKYNEGKLLRNIGNIYMWEENYEKAEEYYLEASTLIGMLGDEQGEAESLFDLGSLLSVDKEYDAAINSFKNSYNIFIKQENKSKAGFALHAISYSYLALGKIEPALNYANASLEFAREISDTRLELNSLIIMGEINYWIGLYEKVQNIFLQSEELAYNINDTYYLGISHQYLGQLMLHSGNSEKALKH
ncbi:MAG: protein kinase, partial [Candidatus Neomarinimicrobiota bacterium]